MKTFIKSAMIASLALGVAGYGAGSVPSEAMAQTRSEPAKSSALPDSIRNAAIKGQASGKVAGARIGNTDFFVVYVKSTGLCGSAGCRAQIWAREGSKYVRKQSLPVGYLPVSVLPQSDKGMPRLGISVDDENLRPATLVVAFDGKNYSLSDWDNLLPANAGKVIVSDKMLKSF